MKINAVVGFLDAQSKVQNKSGVDADASQLKCIQSYWKECPDEAVEVQKWLLPVTLRLFI